MKTCRRFTESLGRVALILAGLLLLVPAGQVWAAATTVADVCAFPGNVCAAGVATINAVTPVNTDPFILPATPATVANLDFAAAGFPDLRIAATGALVLNDKTIPQVTGKTVFNGCNPPDGFPPPGKGSPAMVITAGKLLVAGNINGDVPGPLPGGDPINGGFITINLNAAGALDGSLDIVSGGRISSDRGLKGSGKGGDIIINTDGNVNVRLGGLLESNALSETVNVYKFGCGQTRITVNSHADVIVDGTVQIVNSTSVAIGGIITLNGASAPVDDTTGHVNINKTGIVLVACTDEGGCRVIIRACDVLVEGLIQVGFNPSTGEFGREGPGFSLAVIVEITANDVAKVQNGGQIIATIREGFKAHKGQAHLDVKDNPCQYTPVSPAPNNGPDLTYVIDGTSLGASDICITAGDQIIIDGSTFVGGNSFAVEANNRGGSQKGGSVVLLVTREGDSNSSIDLGGNAINASVIPPSTAGLGGQIHIQSADDVDFAFGVGAIVKADGLGKGGKGGKIQVDAVGPLAGGAGAITGTTGLVEAIGIGGLLPNAIQFFECLVNPADNPATNPAFGPLAGAACGVAAIRTVPSLLPCGAACACLTTFKVKTTPIPVSCPIGHVLTIKGDNLKVVKLVEFNTSCNSDPGVGSETATFLTKTADTITLCLDGLTFTNAHIILSDPLNGPSTSCSTATLSFP